MTRSMSEAKKSLFEGSTDWKARAREVVEDSTIEYDGKRVEQFIKRAFAYKGSFDKTLKPSKNDFGAFPDRVLTAGLEEVERHQDDEEFYTRRIAEIALITDGLYGVDYIELGRIYRDSLAAIRKEGSYMVWRSAIGRVVGSVREDFETSASSVEEAHRRDTEGMSKVVANVEKKIGAKSGANKREYKSAVEPDYADIQDVIKYLYEAGIVSPSHAAALMVTLGFQRPEGEISNDLKQDMNRIRNDLRARITAYSTRKLTTFEHDGIRVLEGFIAQSTHNPNLQLLLADESRMIAVGSMLVNLHQQGEVRNKLLPERPDKYYGMGSIIKFDE